MFTSILVGEFYYEGRVVAQNFEIAIQWFRRSADLLNVEAMVNLCKCYLYGFGVKVNLHECERWGQMAIKNGYCKPPFWRTGYTLGW